MSQRSGRTPRLFVDADLAVASDVACGSEQVHYLGTVMRKRVGDPVRLFNGRDGEWEAVVAEIGKRLCRLNVVRQVGEQARAPDLELLFAPLKRARLDYMVQKAVELGVRRLRPVMTRYTQAERLNLGRMRANVVEAAEQCGVTWLAQVDEPVPLTDALTHWDAGRRLIFCDEAAAVADPVAVLVDLGPGPMGVLIGPEGGFSPDERALLLDRSHVTAISLGPRVMRADTAAVAALALVNAVVGDWRGDERQAEQGGS